MRQLPTLQIHRQSKRPIDNFRTLERLVAFSLARGVVPLIIVVSLSGCRFFSGDQATRTPIPTFTPTPNMAVAPASESATGSNALPTQGVQPAQAVVQAPTNSPPPPTATPTSEPTSTPTEASTATPIPTETPTPQPTAPPDYQFELETAQKFPTESLAVDVVRVYLYVYAPGEFGLPDYGVRITHNGARLDSDAASVPGLPETTRLQPSPYTRFTNLVEIIAEAQSGKWVVQLVDWDNKPVGPPAEFLLTGDEITRELYVRYRRSAE